MELRSYDLYSYENIKNDRLFGIHGVLNTSISQEYIDANKGFVECMNQLSYTALPQYTYSYLNIYNLNKQKNSSICFEYIQVDSRYNKLDINRLNALILDEYAYVALYKECNVQEYNILNISKLSN